MAAAGYGVYAVQVRVLCPQNEELYSMSLLLGYIGTVIMLPLLPYAIYAWTKVEVTWTIFSIVIVKGLLEYVLSEYLHFRAVVLTNATVGLGLAIPMAFVADWIMDKANIMSVSSFLGAVAVTAGFLIVSLGSSHDKGHEVEDEPPVADFEIL
jgi:solute carrier family 35 protein F5